MGQNYTMVAKTLFGLEDVLAEELHQLGALKITKGVRNVQFEG
ncbi:MAG: class I SAM-dependent RNA methyltransferase, partial [Chitinophagaceae bacterium]|nr:class I SAM-dependent RNA methyltransferase [Chitinophagaceae bacterium]